MTPNQDALEVAQAVDCFVGCSCPKAEAAAHIRRLVQENDRLRALLQSAAEYIVANTFGPRSDELLDAITAELEIKHDPK